MIIAHYAHRLPVNHDMAQIRARARERGPQWDEVPELYFKGFLLRERGRHGAIANNYSSLYLWRQDEAFRDFVMTGKYNVVTDTLGRPVSRTHFALTRAEDMARPLASLTRKHSTFPWMRTCRTRAR